MPILSSVYWVAKNETAMNKVGDLLDLLEFCEVNISENYHSSRIFTEILKTQANLVLEPIIT